MKTNTIYNIDNVLGLSQLSDNVIDLVVTSPPYDNIRQYNGFNFNLDELIKQLFRTVKDGGVIVWIVNSTTIGGSETTTPFKHVLSFVDNGFRLNDTMIWHKTNPMPEVKQPRYRQSFEYMFVFSKGKPKTFNPLQQPCKCAGRDYNSTAKQITKDGNIKRTTKSFKINPTRIKDNVWDIAIAQNKTKHPAVFPLQLAKDHILSWSNENDLICDPFMGSGTTALACIELNRQYIGYEISDEYCVIAQQQIDTYIKSITT